MKLTLMTEADQNKLVGVREKTQTTLEREAVARVLEAYIYDVMEHQMGRVVEVQLEANEKRITARNRILRAANKVGAQIKMFRSKVGDDGVQKVIFQVVGVTDPAPVDAETE